MQAVRGESMEIKIAFDEERMRRYHDRGSPLFFGIHWTHQGQAYPAEYWLDFGAVILGWWLGAATKLLEGSTEQKFSFMDGPFSLMARREGRLLRVSGETEPVDWTIPLEDVTAALLRAADEVHRELLRLDMAGEEREGLASGIQQLEQLRRGCPGSNRESRRTSALPRGELVPPHKTVTAMPGETPVPFLDRGQPRHEALLGDPSSDRLQVLFQLMREHAPDGCLGDGANEQEIRSCEEQLGVVLPESYRRFLSEFAWATWPTDIYGIPTGVDEVISVIWNSRMYRNRVEPRMPRFLIPFCNNDWGSYWCLDTAALVNRECPVVFWDLTLDEKQQPLRTHPTFLDWLEGAIQQELEHPSNDNSLPD
jgi:antitoxin YobK